MFNCKKLFKLQIRPPNLILLITTSQDRWIFPSQSWEVRSSIIIIRIIIIIIIKLSLSTRWRSREGVKEPIAPLILNLGTRWRWVVNATPRALYPREEGRFSLYRKLGGPQIRLWCLEKKKVCPCRDDDDDDDDDDINNTSYNHHNQRRHKLRPNDMLCPLPQLLFSSGQISSFPKFLSLCGI